MILLVGASNPKLNTFEQNKEVELKQTCVINGSFCGGCNISSVDYPNGSIAISDVEMTKRTADFNYTLNKNYTSMLGTYTVNGYCRWNDVLKNFVYYFTVTPNGEELTEGQAIINVFLTLILFGLIVSFAYFIIVIPKENERNSRGDYVKIIKLKYLRIMFIAFLYPLIIILLNLMNGLAVNFSTLSMFSGIIGFLFEVMLRGAWIFTVVIILWIIYKMIQDSNIQKTINKIGRFRLHEL